MKRKLLLTDQEREIVRTLLRRHLPEGVEAFVFGSRVDQTAVSTSDLDILLKGPGPIDLKVMALLRESFEESALPFRVDILDEHAMSDRMRRNIGENIIKIV